MRTVQFPSYKQAPPKLVAGARGLDFLNTVEWRGDMRARGERLTSYAELIFWCAAAGVVTGREASALRREAERHPRTAARVLGAAVELREAAVAALTAPTTDSRAVKRLNDRLSGMRFGLRIERAADGVLRGTAPSLGAALRRPLDRIAHDIVAMLGSLRPRQVRSCGNERCGWFFIDASRNRTRRWCRMAACGNQAKARTHYARRRRRGR